MSGGSVPAEGSTGKSWAHERSAQRGEVSTAPVNAVIFHLKANLVVTCDDGFMWSFQGPGWLTGSFPLLNYLSPWVQEHPHVFALVIFYFIVVIGRELIIYSAGSPDVSEWFVSFASRRRFVNPLLFHCQRFDSCTEELFAVCSCLRTSLCDITFFFITAEINTV